MKLCVFYGKQTDHVGMSEGLQAVDFGENMLRVLGREHASLTQKFESHNVAGDLVDATVDFAKGPFTEKFMDLIATGGDCR